MFKVGDVVVHPARGAGVIAGIEEFERNGNPRRYYRIELVAKPGISLMVPIKEAETIGLRHAVSQSKLSKVWHVLRACPRALPDDHKKRYGLLEERLRSGDILQVAEAVRDLIWRQREIGLTGKGRRFLQRALTVLAGEIAAVQGIGVEEAEAQIRAQALKADVTDSDGTKGGEISIWRRIRSGGRRRWPDTSIERG